MDLIRFSQIENYQTAVWGILYPWYPVGQLLLPAALFVNKPHELDAFDVVVIPDYLVRQALCPFIINTARFNAEKHILRAKTKSEVLRVAHGHQSRFKYIDPATFNVEGYYRLKNSCSIRATRLFNGSDDAVQFQRPHYSVLCDVYTPDRAWAISLLPQFAPDVCTAHPAETPTNN